MHDVIAHSLSVIVVQAAAERRVLPPGHDSTAETLASIEHGGRQAMSELRLLLGLLRKGDGELSLAPQPGLGDLVAEVREAGLAAAGFWASSQCHRLSTSGGLYMLQCGDPTATASATLSCSSEVLGTGGPGYQYASENLANATYPAGTVAMANAGTSDSNGSQFFLVYKNTDLPPDYTPFGTITSGLAILQDVASAGTEKMDWWPRTFSRLRVPLTTPSYAATPSALQAGSPRACLLDGKGRYCRRMATNESGAATVMTVEEAASAITDPAAYADGRLQQACRVLRRESPVHRVEPLASRLSSP